MNRKEISFNEFVKLCIEAEKLVQDLMAKHIKLQGKKPSRLKVAMIYILAETKGLDVTFNQLHLIYNCYGESFFRNKKLLKEAMDGKGEPCWKLLLLEAKA